MHWEYIILQIVVFALAITVHESAHAWAANRLGDPTAKMLGRISLNPVVHVDPFGTLLFPVLLALMGQPIFGWAKPVPVNPLNLRRPLRDGAWISAAGPLSNIGLALVSIILFRLLMVSGLPRFDPEGKETVLGVVAIFLIYSTLINLILAAFNLIPIPPLDGGGILAGLLPEQALGFLDRIRPYGFLILIALIYTGVTDTLIGFVYKLASILLGSS